MYTGTETTILPRSKIEIGQIVTIPPNNSINIVIRIRRPRRGEDNKVYYDMLYERTQAILTAVDCKITDIDNTSNITIATLTPIEDPSWILQNSPDIQGTVTGDNIDPQSIITIQFKVLVFNRVPFILDEEEKRLVINSEGAVGRISIKDILDGLTVIIQQGDVHTLQTDQNLIVWGKYIRCTITEPQAYTKVTLYDRQGKPVHCLQLLHTNNPTYVVPVRFVILTSIQPPFPNFQFLI